MGMYCCCGVKKCADGWVCECDWNEWFLCHEIEHLPVKVAIKLHPDVNGIYDVRTFECGDYFEEKSSFCTEEKNWGAFTNQAISKWEIVYDDHWTGFKGVYAWKGKF